MKRLLLLVALLLVAVPGAARAENAEQVAAALRTSPVFQQGGVDLVDVAGLKAELDGTDPQIYLAVLSASAASSDVQARSRAVDIGKALGDSDAVVLVITENEHFGAGAGAAAADRGVDARQALSAARKDVSGFSKDDLTALVTSFAERVAQQASGQAGGDSSGGGSSGGTNLVPWLVGGALVAGAGAYVVRGSRKRKANLNEGLRADVEQLYNRLASDVSTLDPGDNQAARQALADAAERYNATGATLATADSPPEFAAARRTAIEGLTAAQAARTALGLPPGPEVPSLGGGGEQLTAEQRVQFQGQEYDGSPTYQPGRGHYFEGGYVGGQQVPGGWYSAPFWTPFLLGGILTGGFGGGMLGGGGGFERGYEAGRDEADHDGGGDWGGGGGDWGAGGGGDWGGGGDVGGGGDW